MPTRSLVYQEILYDVKPDVIIEAGTYKGGSALYLASIFDLIGKGRVITIDIAKRENRPVHDRVTYLLGSSTSDEIVREVESLLLILAEYSVVFGYSACLAGVGAARCAPTPYFASISKTHGQNYGRPRFRPFG